MFSVYSGVVPFHWFYCSGSREEEFQVFFNYFFWITVHVNRSTVLLFLVVPVYSGVLFWFTIRLLFQFYGSCGLMLLVYSGVVPFHWFYCSELFRVVVSVYLSYCSG
jgi:hypothetical protein